MCRQLPAAWVRSLEQIITRQVVANVAALQLPTENFGSTRGLRVGTA